MGTEARETVIRQFSAGDITEVCTIENSTFFDAWNESMWLDELNNSLTTYIVMEENGKVTGYAGYWLVAGEDYARSRCRWRARARAGHQTYGSAD